LNLRLAAMLLLLRRRVLEVRVCFVPSLLLGRRILLLLLRRRAVFRGVIAPVVAALGDFVELL
jgi:hypothetical protein